MSPRDRLICDTTPIRHLAIVGQFDLLVAVAGGVVHVAREVLDPEEQEDQIPALRSEIVRAERYFLRRSRAEDHLESYSRLTALRRRTDLEIVDLDGEEVAIKADVQSRAFSDSLGLAGPLGDGEAATIAVVQARGWSAAMDDGPARAILHHRVPDAEVFTTREVIRMAVSQGMLTSPEAEIIYSDILAHGYRGQSTLW